MGLARGWVHYLLIFLCVLLATQVMQLGVIKSDADGPRVCEMDLIVINVFFRMYRAYGRPLVLKGSFSPRLRGRPEVRRKLVH